MLTQAQNFLNSKTFGQEITSLINKENLSQSKARQMFYEILANNQSEMHQGAFLAALAAKGPTVEEIAGSFEAIYELDTIKVFPEVNEPLVENSGTGMDSIDTFNISTAASIVAAAAGVTVAKHGSRAITSSSGTIDILEELGINVECNANIAKESIEKAGIGIFNGMSPEIHPRSLGRILSQISFGTILNTSASLANPALPQYGVRGVYSKELLNSMPHVMKKIGYKKAIVIHGTAKDKEGGMDEASTLGETFVAELKENGRISYYSFEPEEMGVTKATKEAIEPYYDIKIEAKVLTKVLSGEDYKPRQDIVCLNSAPILYLMSLVPTIKEGVELSRDIINSGKALDKLHEWKNYQK